VQVELTLPRLRLGQEALDLVVLDGRLVAVDLLHLLRHDIERMHLVVLCEQDGQRKTNVTGTGNCDFHDSLFHFEGTLKRPA